MTVFKAFLKIINKNKMIILLYTVLLIVFGVLNARSSNPNTVFQSSKPDVMIVNRDQNKGMTKNLINYLSKHCHIVHLKDDEKAINDGLFYRDINYVVYIPKGYHQEFMKGHHLELSVKSTNDYQASLAKLILTRYLKTADIYAKSITDEKELIKNINETLSKTSKVNIISKIDTNKLSQVSFYYNFASYSILACLIYVISLIIYGFKKPEVRKRILISSINYKTFNRQLLLSNCLFAFMIWLIYAGMSMMILGKVMLSLYGLLYILNSFIFTFTATAIAFFIGQIVFNKNVINGVVNVVALGSSFLCGAFVPVRLLPENVLKIAHILPSYYFINSNELLSKIETVNLQTIYPVLINILILLLFALFFIILTNIITRKKRKIN
ncbi:ABC transporter permease [Eggerthia catenaformis]|uniref:ABC transporter permease n=1 Tax=Eggerthia catenaformis TaxID=31973 RepID=UPI0028E6F123|nr:ABC transporter permease [Eggerthia catenaformis]